MKTLKERYVERKKNLDEMSKIGLSYGKSVHLAHVNEALDPAEAKNINIVVTKLNAIKKAADNAGAQILSKGIKDAADEINSSAGGGFATAMKKGAGFLQRLLGARAGESPLLKGLMFLNTLESGFYDLPSLIKNNIPDFDDKSEDSVLEQAAEDENAEKNLVSAARKAFVPEGFYASIKGQFGSGGIPFIENIDELLRELLETIPSSGLTEIIRVATGGESTEDIEDSVRDAAKSGGGGTQVPKPGQGIENAQQLAAVIAQLLKLKPEVAAEKPKEANEKFVNVVSQRSKQPEDVVKKIIAALVKNKKLKMESLRLRAALLNEIKIPSDIVNDIQSIDIKELPQSIIDLTKKLRKDDSMEENEFRTRIRGPISTSMAGGGQKDRVKNQKMIDLLDKLEGLNKKVNMLKKLKDVNIDQLILLFKSKNLDLSKEDDKVKASKSISEQYGVDEKLAAAYLKQRVIPQMEKKKDSDVSSNPLEAGKSKVKSAESLKDLLDILKAMKQDAVIAKNKKGKNVPLSSQVKVLAAIIEDPDKAENLIKNLVEVGGLKSKVIVLLKNRKKSKHTGLIKSIESDIKGIDPAAVEAVLDAIESYKTFELVK